MRKPDIQTEQAYKQESAAQLYRGKHIQQFAPFRATQSAYQTWTPGQVVLLSVLAAITMVSIILIGISTLTAVFSIVTLFYVALLGLSVAWLIGVSRPAPSTPFSLQTIDELKHAPWPSYTILCPLYREKAIVPQFVEAMRALDYPADCLQVLFLTEQDDDETRRAILSMNLPDHFEVLTVPPGTPRTKPRACNYGLLHATGEYVVIFDAEDVPDPLQLKKAVLTFASVPPEVACVQAKLNFYNPAQNVLTRWFTIEYSLWFDLILPGLQRIGFSLPLGGTSNHFRASMLRALGAWDAFNVTEDCDLGLKLAEQGLQTVVMDSTTYEEANSRPFSWIKQRSRWIKGYMQTYLIHTRHPLKPLKKGKIKDALSLHLFVGTGSMILLVNPVMWAMFAAYLIWRPVALYHQLFPWPVLYAGMLCFLVGNFLPIYASMVACVKREHYSLVKWCLLLPLYWILASVAAFLAGYELFTAPHKWHKTAHGLHLKTKGDTSKVAAVKAQTTRTGSATSSAVAMAGVTASVRAMPTILLPAFHSLRLKRKTLDRWVCVVIVLASLCSIASTVYYYLHHDILLYGDAYSHMNIARSVIDGYTPGLAQLGGVWLPLPHLLMIPFIWNNFLWQTGLAGSIPSMVCYVMAALFLFLSTRRFTQNNWSSFAGVLVFLLNPNVLYLQSTPLSEPVCFATFAFASYCFIAWAQEDKVKYLVLAAVGAFLSSIARYGGWFLFASMFVLVAVIGVIRRQRKQQIIAYLVMIGVLGSAGIFLWLAWSKVIFGDPLYFQHGVYSSQAHMQYFYAHSFGARGDLWLSVKEYSIAIIDTFGPVMPLLALLAIGYFFLRKGSLSAKIAALSFLSPLAFYTFSFYSGQVVIMVPGFSSYIFIYLGDDRGHDLTPRLCISGQERDTVTLRWECVTCHEQQVRPRVQNPR
jgi:cellulose synthase/poly-beta-1,6-N-acetylglucosamine synthase-like glycosyltransferase